MREQLLDAMAHRDDLDVVDADFVHLFSSWFNRGFLVLRRIDWSTPAIVLEKIIRYEAVHRIRGWDDLRRRIDPADRRCYAFFHPALVDEPLIFVEVAFTREIPGAIAPILTGQREVTDPERATTAVFYSISNCQRGLAGVSFGHFLIKQVAEEISREIPNIATFVTLSPAPGFAAWLARERQQVPSTMLTEEDKAALAHLDTEGWWQMAHLREAVQEALCHAAACYFLQARTKRGTPVDPVARFHLGNGARLEQIDLLADTSSKGMSQSHGLMVNYLYDLKNIEKNHEAYAENRTIVASNGVRRLARGRVRELVPLRQHRKQVVRLVSTCRIRPALPVSLTFPGAKPPARWIDAHSCGTPAKNAATAASSVRSTPAVKLYLLVVAEGKVREPFIAMVGNMAGSARRDQGADDGATQGAGATGDDDMTAAVVHARILPTGIMSHFGHGSRSPAPAPARVGITCPVIQFSTSLTRSPLSSTAPSMPWRQASGLLSGSRSSTIKLAGVAQQVLFRGEEPFLHQPHAGAAHDRRELAQRIFRMILHAPGDGAVVADLRRLHAGHGVERQHGGVGRQRLDLVEMDRHGLEAVGLAVVHRVLAAGRREPDGTAEPDLAPLGVAPHAAARRDHQELQAPAAAEYRRAAVEHRARKLDLPPHLRRVLIDVQRRAGDGDPVVAFQPAGVGKIGAGIGRIGDVDDGAGRKLAQQVGISLACDHAAGGLMTGTALGRVAFNDEEAGRHQLYPAREARYVSPRPACSLSDERNNASTRGSGRTVGAIGHDGVH